MRGRAWLLVLTLALSAFSLLFVSNTELSLLDNATAVYDMLAVVTGLGALLAVVAGSDAIAGERERGSLMPLLVAPVSRSAIAFGKLGGPLAAWTAMLVIALPYLWAVGSSGQNLASAIASLALLGTPLVVGFGFFALGLGARIGSARGALSLALIALVLCATPLVLGAGLRQTVIGHTLDAINPFAGALNAYDAIVIDSESFSAQAVRALPVAVWLVATLAFALRSVRAVSR